MEQEGAFLPAPFPNMSLDTTIWSTDEAVITAEMSATLQFSDQEVIGMSGPEGLSQRMIDEGFSDSLETEFRALISRFKTPATAPFMNQQFTHKESGKKYRIQKVQRDFPVNLTYIMTCVDLTR